MLLAQARLTPGKHAVGVVNLGIARVRSPLKTAGWPEGADAAASLDEAHKAGATLVADDAGNVMAGPRIEVVVEATSVPAAGMQRALQTIAQGKHIVMVNVEADAVAGPLLASRARAVGVVDSLAWSNQPALICEQVN